MRPAPLTSQNIQNRNTMSQSHSTVRWVFALHSRQPRHPRRSPELSWVSPKVSPSPLALPHILPTPFYSLPTKLALDSPRKVQSVLEHQISPVLCSEEQALFLESVCPEVHAEPSMGPLSLFIAYGMKQMRPRFTSPSPSDMDIQSLPDLGPYE